MASVSPAVVPDVITMRSNKCSTAPRRLVRDPQEYVSGLDDGIAEAVLVLRQAGVYTYASCEGGKGHPYPEPTIRFDGERSEGLRALAIALENGLQVSSLRRIWQMVDGELTGPDWELTFY